MMKTRFTLTLNCLLLISLIITSCSSVPSLPGLTSPPTPTTEYQPVITGPVAPPAITETEPPFNTVIGHLSPITFYFNQPMNQGTVEPAISGLPSGTFTWTDNSTLTFTPAEPYTPNTKLEVTFANKIQSASGFGVTEPLQASFTVADYLRGTNLLPEANSTDVNVEAAIVASFNQPVVPLGADSSSLPVPFNIQPTAKGKGEWINTSTYIFYPNPPLLGGTEYTVSVSDGLKTVSGTGLDGSVVNAWKFITAKPRVVALKPSTEESIPPDTELKLTFNQPMDSKSVESNFLLSGSGGSVNGKFAWNDENTELTFTPSTDLARGVAHTLNVGTGAKSQSGMALATEYGAVLKTYESFTVTKTDVNYSMVSFMFSAPLKDVSYDDLVKVTPSVADLDVNMYDNNLYLYGSFVSGITYNIELSGLIADQWGQSLGTPYSLNAQTPPLPPSLNTNLNGSNTVLVRPDEPVLYGTSINVQSADVVVEPITLQDFFRLQGSFETQQAYTPVNALTYPQTLEVPANQATQVKLSLTQEKTQLPPGLYYVNVTSPQYQSNFKNISFAASSQVNLTFKAGALDALVWAVDLPSQTPINGAAVTIYDEAGTSIATGLTDADGLWRGNISAHDGQVFAVLGSQGDTNFAIATNSWGYGFEAWNFGYNQRVQNPHTTIYMYTDRPIYRPGQTIYYRGVVRQAFNGRYDIPSINSVPILLNDGNGAQLANINAQLSQYGTFNGQIELSADAAPGYYSFSNNSLEFYLSFQVAEYRKPEIELVTSFNSNEIQQGNALQAKINANYYFGAPAGNADVKWSLFTKPSSFYIPGYQTGVIDTEWLNVFRSPSDFGSRYLGTFVEEGTGQTTPQGILPIDLPAIPVSDSTQIVTLEATVTDESGFPVSSRSEVQIHPADFYIGLRPDDWIGTAKSELGFEVFTVDWDRNPSGEKTLTADFKQVRWEKKTDETGFPTYTPVYTSVSSSNFATGADGKARLSFTPPNAGTYMLDVHGGGAHSQVLVWVGGSGTAAWPDLPNQRLELTADKNSYASGETATIFIPNPFATDSLALITTERGLISNAEVISIKGNATEYTLPLFDTDAPNVYVSATVLGQGNNFRSGLINIPVAPDAQALNVQLFSNPTEAGPRDTVTFDVVVTDHQDQPVQGEFSLSVVDKAVLTLADSNVQDIIPAFYSNQPLGIETGLSLATYGGRGLLQPGGLGGGGGADVPFIREDFPDTAYWNPSLITTVEGRGQVTMTLPDSLTTWHIDVRGLTSDTKVGQTATEIVSTKPLLIRPVTPRFLVRDDHVLMAAIVNNNTAEEQKVTVNLQSSGFVLDDPNTAAKTINVKPNSQARVEWWGTAQNAAEADMVFSAVTSGGTPLQDSARPTWGKLPILQYTAPQAFVTGGVLRGAATQQEAVSLPRTFVPVDGSGLDVELSPSLAGSLLSALEAMETPSYTTSAEAIASYLLPNIEVHRSLNKEGLSDPNVSDRIETELNAEVTRLALLQNQDGGWGWWGKSDTSDPYISAYVLLCLSRAQSIGAETDQEVIDRAVTFLQNSMPNISTATKSSQLDDIAFVTFVLAQTGNTDVSTPLTLFDARDRMSPSGKAWMAYAINAAYPNDSRVRDLITDLETSAIRTATSVHWENTGENIFTRGTPIYNTSAVVYALAQIAPSNQILFDAVNYLTAHRSARKLWNIGHDNAWAILSLNEAMNAFGDLRSDFTFNAALNGNPLTGGDINGIQLTPLRANVPIEFLYVDKPSLLTIQRDDGLGRLYYNATLKVNRPVQDVQPLNNGMSIERVYCLDAGERCAPLSSLKLDSTQPITTQLTLTLPHDSYYIIIEDPIPAGTEILDQNLKTSQLGIDATDIQTQFDDTNPFSDGWGWWLFNTPQIHDDGITFTANYLPAGTYTLTYTLVPTQAGEFHVMPAHTWQSFFPDSQGTSAGMVIEIKP